MNIALEQTEELVAGAVKSSFGGTFFFLILLSCNFLKIIT